MNEPCGLRHEISFGLGHEISEVDRLEDIRGRLEQMFPQIEKDFGFELVAFEM